MTSSYVQREWRQAPSRTPELLDDSRRTPFPPQPQNSVPSTDRQGAPLKDFKLRFTGSEEILTRLKSSNYLQPFSAVPESTSAQLSAIAAVRFLAAGASAASGDEEHHAVGTTVQEREHTRNSNKNAVVAPHRRHYVEVVPMTVSVPGQYMFH